MLIYLRFDLLQVAFGFEVNFGMEFARINLGPLSICATWAVMEGENE